MDPVADLIHFKNCGSAGDWLDVRLTDPVKSINVDFLNKIRYFWSNSYPIVVTRLNGLVADLIQF